MNYRRIYFSLIRKRKNTLLNGCYFERHHIIPKSLGGSDDKKNIVHLLAREHYIAHLLLARMFSNKIKNAKMKLAVAIMLLNGKNQERYYINSRRFEKIRILISEGNSLLQDGINNSQFGTMWITNKIQNKKIKQGEVIPVGWELGRFTKEAKIREEIKLEKLRLREIKKKEKEVFYTRLYELYVDGGWIAIKNEYPHSKPNFVKECQRYVKSFKPQNGKKRGK